jgi:hypothetical protein
MGLAKYKNGELLEPQGFGYGEFAWHLKYQHCQICGEPLLRKENFTGEFVFLDK